jgi:hypothetical protein
MIVVGCWSVVQHSPAEAKILARAFDQARLALLDEARIPVSEVGPQIRQAVMEEVEPLYQRLRELPNEAQTISIIERAMRPSLERHMPRPVA